MVWVYNTCMCFAVGESKSRRLLMCYVFVVMCRLSTIRHADCIVVMEDGVVVETGSHEQLLQQEGVYSNLVQAQVG